MGYTRRSSREEVELSHEVEPSVSGTGEPSIARELEAIPYEPLLPIEKKLIVSCLVLGILLLGLLLWASTTFFPVAGPAVRRPRGESSHERATVSRLETTLTRRASISRGIGVPPSLARRISVGRRKC
jgi:hypothetical protein